MIVNSGKWPCGVCGKGVQATSVQGTVCTQLIHKPQSGVYGDLSRVDNGFRCSRCDGTIQEADLAEDLVHSVHIRSCRIYEQSGPNNKQQSTTHGNATKGSGSDLRPKTHIQHTHPQHLSTSTQTSTNHKSTHCNRMR